MQIASLQNQVALEEWQLRVDLVAAYGMRDLVVTHISVRIPGRVHHPQRHPPGARRRRLRAAHPHPGRHRNELPAGRRIADLGDKKYLMLRNHGLLTIGRTVADAFLAMYTFENTCRIQMDALAGGQALTPVRPDVLDGMAEVSRAVAAGQGAGLVWPALLRKLLRTNTSCRT